MAYTLKLPRKYAKMRGKVKIRAKERLEDPHITIIHGTKVWRVELRDGSFLDGGSWMDMPDGLEAFVTDKWEQLCQEWDKMYPHNPIDSDEDADADKNA